MKSRLEGGSEIANVEFQQDGDTVRYRVWKDGEPESEFQEASLLEVEPGIYSVVAGGRSFDVRLQKAHYGVAVQVMRQRFVVKPVSRRPAGVGGRGQAAGAKVSASMPGKIVTVLVAEGDMVEEGAGLAVVEAMKMQNEMKAPCSGKVRKVAVSEGQTVAAGELIVHIEAEQ
jgi:biotin carboxyl carrier protein